jgi:hypothetical protein
MISDWNHPPEWYFSSVRPDKREPANEDERRIHLRLYGGCLHSMWTREQDTNGARFAKCDRCGAHPYLGRDKTTWSDADPVMSDREIQATFDRMVPNYRYDDVLANKLFRDIEHAGWHCLMHSLSDRFACSMEKGAERFLSTAHDTKAAAISEGRKGYKLESRHARLAVNAAHTVATFIMETWDRKTAKKT